MRPGWLDARRTTLHPNDVQPIDCYRAILEMSVRAKDNGSPFKTMT